VAIQTQAQACAELDDWYLARQAVQDGRSFQLTTSGGTRLLTLASIDEIQRVITQLERKCAGVATTGDKQGLHDFALANMGDNKANP